MNRERTSHTYICIHSAQTALPSRLPHNIEQSSLCWTVGPYWLSILNRAVRTCPSQTPNCLLITRRVQCNGPEMLHCCLLMVCWNRLWPTVPVRISHHYLICISFRLNVGPLCEKSMKSILTFWSRDTHSELASSKIFWFWSPKKNALAIGDSDKWGRLFVCVCG